MKNIRTVSWAIVLLFLEAAAFSACDSNNGREDADVETDEGADFDGFDAEVQVDPAADPAIDTPDDPLYDQLYDPPDDSSGDPVDDSSPPPPGAGVDILVVVDNSGSMAEEQQALKLAFPQLISALLDPPVDPVSGERVHEPVRDMHIGVVSTDMGVGGYDVQTCDEPISGDDGILMHMPRAEGCAPSYPDFLSYLIGGGEEPSTAMINALSDDFGCIATLGTSGCGFEQQLEAARKALVVHSATGGANAGFLREDTILIIVFLTDEEDCSADDTSIYDIVSLPYSINLQCYYQKGKLHGISRYATDFMGLRTNPDYLLAVMLVGVPQDPACIGGGDDLAGCLAVEEMQEVVRPDGELLEFSCKYPPGCTPPDPPDSGTCLTTAFPPIRFVQLARQLGESGMVLSICTGNYGPPFAAIAERVAEILE